MLLCKHRRRHKYRGLLAAEHAFHHRAQCDFRLAEADVAAEQSIHRHGRLHVALYLRYRAELIVGLSVAEVILKFALPLAVRREGVARQALPLGVERDELFRHVLGRALGARAGLCPFRAAHLRELDWLLFARSRVFRHHVELCCGDIQAVRPGVAYLYIVLFKSVHLHLDDTGKAADAVVLVYHIVAHREVGAGLYFLPPRRELFLGFFSGLIAYQLCIGQYREPYSGVLHARGNGADAYRTAPRLRQLFKLLIYQRPDVLAAEEILQDLGAPLVRREDHHAVVLLEIQRHIIRRRLRAARVRRQLLCGYAGYCPRRQGTAPHGEGFGHIHREVLQPLYQRLPAEIKCVRRHCQHSAPRQFADVLGELLCVVPRPLAAAAGLVEDDHRILRDVIHGACHRVNHGQIPIRVRYQRSAAEPVGVCAQSRAEHCRVLARAATAIFLREALYLAAERIAPADGHLRQSLRRREYHAFFKRLRAALARHVEMTH